MFFFQGFYEFVSQIVGLVDESDHEIDGLIWEIGEMGKIGGIGESRIASQYLPYHPYLPYFPNRFFFRPYRYLVLPGIRQKIFE